jgi:uncharacterized protein YbcI
MASTRTLGQVEAAVATSITTFEREHLGRGPQEVRAWIVQDMILVRLKGVLTPAEEKLAQDPEGYRLVKEVRTRLVEGSRSLLDKMVLDHTGVRLVSLHSDISIKTGERVFVFTVAENLELKFRR